MYKNSISLNLDDVFLLSIVGFILADNIGIIIIEYHRQNWGDDVFLNIMVSVPFIGGFSLCVILAFFAAIRKSGELAQVALGALGCGFAVATISSFAYILGLVWLAGFILQSIALSGSLPYIGLILGTIVGVIIASKTHKFILQGIMSLARI